jgi:hypothetical protein
LNEVLKSSPAANHGEGSLLTRQFELGIADEFPDREDFVDERFKFFSQHLTTEG